MDVTAPRPPDPTGVAAYRAEPARGAEARWVPPTDEPTAPAGGDPAFRPPSSLKFTLTAADVDARFEIHEATSAMTVTMYDRQSGEVLREFPSREVLDVIASLVSSGLTVDEMR